MESTSFMTEEGEEIHEVTMEVSNVVNQSSDESSIVAAQAENSIQLISTQSPSMVHDEDKTVFNTMTVVPSSTEPNQSPAYLPAQSVSNLSHLTCNAILSTHEISDSFSGSFANAGTQYMINTPQLSSLQTVQTLGQSNNAPVVLLQVPTSQCSNQVVMAHVTNGQFQTGNIQLNVAQAQHNVDSSPEQQRSKKSNTKTRFKGRSKSGKIENSTPLRPLAPRMFAVPVSSPVLVAAQSGNQQVFTQVTPMDQLQQLPSVSSNQNARTAGQHFEVLGRCFMCFRFCRTTTYCRAEKNHTEVRAAACAECEEKGDSTVVCRMKRQHKAPNAYPPNIVINTALQRPLDLKEMCLKNLLPVCFSELQSLTVHHADCVFTQPRAKVETDNQVFTIDGVMTNEQTSHRKPTDYARGYLYPHSKENWDRWLEKFCAQTGTSYRIRTGKRVNKKSDHGLANHNGKIVVYRALETQLYNCALGGKPRRKALREGSKRRKSRGSKLIGCSAVILTRLIVTEEDWKALEITLPKLSAHLPAHDPRATSNELQADMNNMLLQTSLYGSDQGVTNDSQDFAILDDVGFQPDTDAALTTDQMHLLNSLQSESIRKQSKILIKGCSVLLDGVSNLETLKAANMQIQSLHSQLQKYAADGKRNGKRTAADADLVEGEEILDEGESNHQDTVGQVVLLQAESE